MYHQIHFRRNPNLVLKCELQRARLKEQLLAKLQDVGENGSPKIEVVEEIEDNYLQPGQEDEEQNPLPSTMDMVNKRKDESAKHFDAEIWHSQISIVEYEEDEIS